MLGGGLATGDLSETPACKRSFDANGPAHKTAGPTPWQNSFAQSTATTRRNQHHAALIRRPFHSLKTCMASLQGHAPAHAQTQAPCATSNTVLCYTDDRCITSCSHAAWNCLGNHCNQNKCIFLAMANTANVATTYESTLQQPTSQAKSYICRL